MVYYRWVITEEVCMSAAEHCKYNFNVSTSSFTSLCNLFVDILIGWAFRVRLKSTESPLSYKGCSKHFKNYWLLSVTAERWFSLVRLGIVNSNRNNEQNFLWTMLMMRHLSALWMTTIFPLSSYFGEICAIRKVAELEPFRLITCAEGIG